MQGKCVLCDFDATLNTFVREASDVKEALTGRQPMISTFFFFFSMTFLIIVLVALFVDVLMLGRFWLCP